MISKQPYYYLMSLVNLRYILKKQSRNCGTAAYLNSITFLLLLPYILKFYNQLPTKELFTLGLLCSFLLLRATFIL